MIRFDYLPISFNVIFLKMYLLKTDYNFPIISNRISSVISDDCSNNLSIVWLKPVVVVARLYNVAINDDDELCPVLLIVVLLNLIHLMYTWNHLHSLHNIELFYFYFVNLVLIVVNDDSKIGFFFIRSNE